MAGRRQIPSLRANGSRERAPDDRLSEAIQISNRVVNGLLRRVAPRKKVENLPEFPIALIHHTFIHQGRPKGRYGARNDGRGGAHVEGAALNTRRSCPLPCWSAR